MNTNTKEVFISVDIETSGPAPELYSLLSIGACVVDNDAENFSCLVKPTSDRYDPKALEVSGLSLQKLNNEGFPPSLAMENFAEWIKAVSGDGKPIFVGLNAAFDWSFINYYFHKYFGSNPFGFAPLDIKALFMGKTNASWSNSKSSVMTKVLNPQKTPDHTALHDATFQAELFSLIISHKVKNKDAA